MKLRPLSLSTLVLMSATFSVHAAPIGAEKFKADAKGPLIASSTGSLSNTSALYEGLNVVTNRWLHANIAMATSPDAQSDSELSKSFQNDPALEPVGVKAQPSALEGQIVLGSMQSFVFSQLNMAGAIGDFNSQADGPRQIDQLYGPSINNGIVSPAPVPPSIILAGLGGFGLLLKRHKTKEAQPV